MDLDARIFVAGPGGMIGSALVRCLRARGCRNLLTPTRRELDLLDQRAVRTFFETERPEYVFLAAGRSGGVYANNTYRADFLYENLVIQSNVLHHAFLSEVRKLLFFGSNCVYPSHCAQPMSEDDIATGPLEATSEPFAVAKLAGLKLCDSYNRQYGTEFLSVVPANVYGPTPRGDDGHSMVIPSLISRFHHGRRKEAPEVVVWGSGTPLREFLFVDDLADAACFLMNEYDGNLLLNVPGPKTHSIAEVAEIVREVVGYSGQIRFDPTLPDGAHSKRLDGARLASLGWEPHTGLREGIDRTYAAMLASGTLP